MRARPSHWLVIKDENGAPVGKTWRSRGLSTGTPVHYYVSRHSKNPPSGVLFAASLVWGDPAVREQALCSLLIFDVAPR